MGDILIYFSRAFKLHHDVRTPHLYFLWVEKYDGNKQCDQ